ncbi:putative membrane protein [Mesorhizobium soli]|uniref:VpsF family polysaccharide biosynthesis protein n=1 Tax=Pseudaminobacter soli (ex Li et al. 2025) TaxID=1295366 RepID=UPI0024746AE2|nr:VpsF family polysaccharide biosynthesis protein [Mesorhizobium soli]MDH6233862.1 putative membrane protein [Mesorhizobium soli]
MVARSGIDEGPAAASIPNLPYRPDRSIVDLLLLAGVVALLSLSNFALEFFGLPYNSIGGSIVSKIHPATYLFSLALGLAVIANRNPVGYLINLLFRSLGSVFLLAACILLWVFISRYKNDQPASFLIDTLMAAALIVMLFADAGERTRLSIARAVHIIMVLNCFLAIVEGLSGWRLFPFVLNGLQQTWEYRATALFGHPLIGALITGVYAVILITVRDVRGLSQRWRLPILLLCMVTMPFIGSRTSFTVVYAVAAAVMGLKALRFLRGGAVSVRMLLAVLVLAPLGVVAVTAMFQMGLFDNFLNRFIHDKSSAQSRIQLFSLFRDFGLREFLVGQTSLVLDTNVRWNGLTEGIENSWVGHLVSYGIVMSAVLWFGIAGWFVDMLRAGGRGAILPLLFVFLIISTTVGISGKTTMLTIPTVLILALVAGEGADGLPAMRPDSTNDVLSRIGRGPPPIVAGGARLPTIKEARLNGDQPQVRPPGFATTPVTGEA